MSYFVTRLPHRRAYFYDEGQIHGFRADFCADFAVAENFVTKLTAMFYKIPIQRHNAKMGTYRELLDTSGRRFVVIGITEPFELSIGTVSVQVVCNVVTPILTQVDERRRWRRWDVIIGYRFVERAREDLGDDFTEVLLERRS